MRNLRATNNFSAGILRFAGRIRPLLLAFILLLVGLSFDKWWWKVGATIILIILVDSFLRFRRSEN